MLRPVVRVEVMGGGVGRVGQRSPSGFGWRDPTERLVMGGRGLSTEKRTALVRGFHGGVSLFIEMAEVQVVLTASGVQLPGAWCKVITSIQATASNQNYVNDERQRDCWPEMWCCRVSGLSQPRIRRRHTHRHRENLRMTSLVLTIDRRRQEMHSTNREYNDGQSTTRRAKSLEA